MFLLRVIKPILILKNIVWILIVLCFCFVLFGLKLHFQTNFSFLRIIQVFDTQTAALEVKTAIIEPRILYSLLSEDHKHLLTKHRFNISEFRGSPNVITYGIFEEDVQKLLEDLNINRLHQVGLRSHLIRDSAPTWFPEEKRLKNGTYITHMFFTYFEFTIHVVVFYERSNYIWHAALDHEMNIVDKKLLFVDHSSAYEKFNMVPHAFHATFTGHYIPSNPHQFLFQIPTSRFLECPSNKSVDYKGHPKKHGYISAKEFNELTVVTLRNLKSLMHPLLMNFWIFSGTMLGWYRDCDIIPYTTDVDFAGWAHELEDIDPIIKFGRKNKQLALSLIFGVPDEALELRFYAKHLQVDFFFLYQINNGSWTSGHIPEKHYYIRYFYPHFTLCSTELLGEKVLVPCETEDIILTEYGKNWRTPVESWSFQFSIKNRGPNIYWNEEKRNKTFLKF